MIITTVVAIASLLGAAFTEQPNVFLLISLLVGFSSVSVQILIPLAAHLAPEESRGRVVGGIMGGLLLGILLARPVSSVVADHLGWRAMFMIAAALMAAISVVLALTVPKRQPDHSATYGQLIGSLWTLLRQQPVLRQRAFTVAACLPRSACSGPPCRWNWRATMACRKAKSRSSPGRRHRSHRRANQRPPRRCWSHTHRLAAGHAVRQPELSPRLHPPGL